MNQRLDVRIDHLVVDRGVGIDAHAHGRAIEAALARSFAHRGRPMGAGNISTLRVPAKGGGAEAIAAAVSAAVTKAGGA